MELVRQPYRVREFRGYALNFAARLEASQPQCILRLLQASSLNRQAFFATAASEIDLDRPEVFLARIEAHAPDVLADLGHLDPLAQVARALILMKPRRTLECLYGACPDGLLGLFERLGSQPLYGAETYRLAFELFSDPCHRNRAKVLGQLPGQIRPEHVAVVASLDERLLHRSVLERCHPREVAALNSFVGMIVDVCDATPALIRESLDQLAVGTRGCKMTEWAEGWLGRQVQRKLDQYGIFYQSVAHPSAEKQALHRLVDHTTAFAWDRQREAADDEGDDTDLDALLDDLEQEIHGREAA